MIRRKPSPQAKRRTSVRTYVLIFVCGLLTVTGFFLAGRQHFSWMDYGMKNSRLRKQIDELQAEKRRLLIARETSLSPAEIKKAAKKFLGGEAPSVTASLTGSTVNPESKDKPQLTPASSDGAKSMILKTVAVTPASSTTAAIKKTDKPIKVTPATE